MVTILASINDKHTPGYGVATQTLCINIRVNSENEEIYLLLNWVLTFGQLLAQSCVQSTHINLYLTGLEVLELSENQADPSVKISIQLYASQPFTFKR